MQQNYYQPCLVAITFKHLLSCLTAIKLKWPLSHYQKVCSFLIHTTMLKSFTTKAINMQPKCSSPGQRQTGLQQNLKHLIKLK